MRSKLVASLAAVAFGGSLLLASAPASAQWRYHHHHGGAGLAAGVIGGLAAGAIIGGALARPYPYYYYGEPVYGEPVYAAPGPAYGGEDWLAYCSSRYKSFDPRTGTYLGYDGVRHPCR